MTIPTLTLALGLLFQAHGPAQDVPAKYMAPPPDKNKVIVRVNGTELTAGEAEAFLWQWRGREVSQDLISYLLLKDEAAREGITVTDKEVEDLMDTQMKQYESQLAQQRNRVPAGTTPPTVDQWLEQNGYPRSRLYLGNRTGLLLDKLVTKAFRPTDFVKVSTINIRPQNEQSPALGAALKTADDAYARLKKGEDWVKVLSSVTPEAQIVASKGMLGWIQLDAFPPTVQTEIKTLKIGEVTKPAQTQYGIQIFRVEGTSADLTCKELEDQRTKWVQASRGSYLAKLRAKAKIENLLPGG